MRATELGEDPALDAGAGETAEFGDKGAHGAALAEVPIARHMGGEIALQTGLVIRNGRMSGSRGRHLSQAGLVAPALTNSWPNYVPR